MRLIKKLSIIFFILFLSGTQACVTGSRNDSAEWFKIGTASLKSGFYNEAATAFDNAIDLNPQYAEAYYQKGLVYGFTGDDDQAIANMKIAARLDFKLAQDFLRKRRIEW
jgi:tetratricopeptide (TPR) repeat protein